jgi:hypothetical protein
MEEDAERLKCEVGKGKVVDGDVTGSTATAVATGTW